ncbi:MAG: glycosyltransferase [Thermoguttaceae bacterium]|jgi:glycosyltransferase involved in cell wall biosynthesis|nr:glycosyltransferase [Thermoguttaceae bacterium]
MSALWLSVIMPTYNGAAHLEAALGSLAAQQEHDFEVIAVDDGSTDRTREILEAFSRRMPMRIVAREHTGNWVAGTNCGMSLARGRYLSWLHQDDAWAADRLAQVRRVTAQWPEALLVFHPVWYIDAAGRRVGRWRCPLPAATSPVPRERLIERLVVQNFIAASAVVFQAAALARLGALDERLWYLADWDFWLRLAREGAVAHHPAFLASFRLHSGSQTVVRSAEVDDIMEQHRIVFARHLAVLGRNSPRARRIAQVARFSAEVSVELRRTVTHGKVDWLRLARDFLRLGPAGWLVFFRDSRIMERSVARIRAGLCRRATTAVGKGNANGGSVVLQGGGPGGRAGDVSGNGRAGARRQTARR